MADFKGKMDGLKKAFDIAWGEATKSADEALDAMQKHDSLKTDSDDSVFSRKANRALESYENWRKAAENMRVEMDALAERLRNK